MLCSKKKHYFIFLFYLTSLFNSQIEFGDPLEYSPDPPEIQKSDLKNLIFYKIKVINNHFNKSNIKSNKSQNHPFLELKISPQKPSFFSFFSTCLISTIESLYEEITCLTKDSEFLFDQIQFQNYLDKSVNQELSIKNCIKQTSDQICEQCAFMYIPQKHGFLCLPVFSGNLKFEKSGTFLSYSDMALNEPVAMSSLPAYGYKNLVFNSKNGFFFITTHDYLRILDIDSFGKLFWNHFLASFNNESILFDVKLVEGNKYTFRNVGTGLFLKDFNVSGKESDLIEVSYFED